MIERLKAELKALAGWDRHSQALRTQAELDAVIFRKLRRREIIALLLKIAARN